MELFSASDKKLCREATPPFYVLHFTLSLLITFHKIANTSTTIFDIIRGKSQVQAVRLHVEPTCPSERRLKMREFRDVTVFIGTYAANRIHSYSP